MSLCFEFDVQTGFCARRFAPVLSSKTVMHIAPKPEKKSINIPHKHYLLGACQCYILGFSGRKHNAFLRPRKPAQPHPRTHHSPTRNWPPISGLASIVCIANVTSSSPLPFRNVMPKSLVEKTYPKIPIAFLQCTSRGLFAYLATTRTAYTAIAIAGRAWFPSHIKHPTNSRKGQ